MSYHITKKGEPGICSASKGKCPLGGIGEHFDSIEEAREAFESKQGGSFDNPPSRDVTNETEFVMESITAAQLKVGDDYEGSPVTDVKVGHKWVTIATEASPKTLEALNTALVVTREVRTAEAKEADKKEWIDESVKMGLERSKKAFDKAQNDFNEHLTKYGQVDGFRLTSLLEAQSNNKIWSQVESRAEKNGETLTEAATGIQEYYKENITRYALRTGLSRSTSQAHNIIEDADNEAIIKFLRHDNFYV